MTTLPGRNTWTDGDSIALTQWADDQRKRDALDRFIAGDDDAFDEVIKDALVAGGMRPELIGTDPLEPEPEDDEETITYPDVWDRAGDKVILWLCAAGLALFWGAPIALSLWAVTR